MYSNHLKLITMAENQENVTITLEVSIERLCNYYQENPNGPLPVIDSYCSFVQSGGKFTRGNGKNEDFKTIVNTDVVKSITWEGASKDISGYQVNILSIRIEKNENVFSSLCSSGNPQNIVGTLEKKPKKENNYSIYFYVEALEEHKKLPEALYKIDPKLEINT